MDRLNELAAQLIEESPPEGVMSALRMAYEKQGKWQAMDRFPGDRNGFCLALLVGKWNKGMESHLNNALENALSKDTSVSELRRAVRGFIEVLQRSDLTDGRDMANAINQYVMDGPDIGFTVDGQPAFNALIQLRDIIAEYHELTYVSESGT